jgi:hypothetical protein
VSIICRNGQKHLHDTVQESKACWLGQARQDEALENQPEYKPARPFDVDATDNQIKFLNTLRSERGIAPYVAVRGRYGVTKQSASAEIDHLIHNVPKTEVTARQGTRKVSYPKVPAGYYATPRPNSSEIDFWAVQVPTDGHFKGMTFLKRVIGGRPESRVKGSQAFAILKKIEADPTTAGKLFAEKLNHCYRCNRHLTEGASRTLGMGETCATQAGLGAKWHELDRQFAQAS